MISFLRCLVFLLQLSIFITPTVARAQDTDHDLITAIEKIGPNDLDTKYDSPIDRAISHFQISNSPFPEDAFHAFVKKYSSTKDAKVRKKIEDILWHLVGQKVLVLSDPMKAELSSVAKDFTYALFNWAPLRYPKFNNTVIKANESFQEGDNDFCFIYSGYMVKTHGYEVGGSISVFPNPHLEGAKNCDKEQTYVFKIADEESADYFWGIYKNYLLVDTGTGNFRKFAVYDLNLKKVVLQTNYDGSNEPHFNAGKLVFGHTEAPKELKCRKLTDEESAQGQYKNIEAVQVTYDLDQALKKTVAGKHCELHYSE